MKTDVYSKVWSCGDENYKTVEALEMKACSQRPGVQSPAWIIRDAGMSPENSNWISFRSRLPLVGEI